MRGSSDWRFVKVPLLKEAGHHNLLPREVAESPRLLKFKECLDNAISHRVQFQAVLQKAWSQTYWPSRVSSHLRYLMIPCKKSYLLLLSDPQSMRKEYNGNNFFDNISTSSHSPCKTPSLYLIIYCLLLSNVKEIYNGKEQYCSSLKFKGLGTVSTSEYLSKYSYDIKTLYPISSIPTCFKFTTQDSVIAENF